MKQPRKKHSPAFKAKVALAAIRGDKTITELAAQYEIHPARITEWRKALIENAGIVFDSGSSKQPKSSEQLIENLYEKIGELTVERDFLSKVLNR